MKTLKDLQCRDNIISKSKIEIGRITPDFLFSVAFVYSKNNNNESRSRWQTLP